MRAVVTNILVKKTVRGNWSVFHRIRTSKAEIVDAVNSYILDRVNDSRLIKVSKFDVKIYDEKTNRVVNSWSYTPTYR